MPLGDNYASMEDLKKRLSIPDTDTQDNAELTAALTATSRGIELLCRRQFNQTTTASPRIFTPRRAGSLDVNDFHTTDDLVVAVDSAEDGSFATTVDPAVFILEPRNGIVDGVDGWPFFRIRWRHVQFYRHPYANRRPEVQVTAQWGWSAVPEPVHEACLIVASEMFKLKDAPFGVAGFGEYGVIRVRQNPIACGMIHPYRWRPVMVG